ncbi:MAG: TIGR03960 family B12-binding radical SAM protein, partial [Propionibacteriaceae bacterium]|nr:TIGR03960 family B12-binding radical SAM protein [Propionibacteriaceae bacterium]
MGRTVSDDSQSVFSRLEPLLARVSTPVQYIGGEVNTMPKDWRSVAVRWCLFYPDTYAVGQPNQGLAILYEVLNEQADILAERSFAVWGDLAALMREAAVPQFSWESHRPIGDFDVIGVGLSTELGYTNLLEALDLAGIPLHAAERGQSDPLVIVGGHVASNPEPIADFIDAAVMGDGEEAVLLISRLVERAKAEGWGRSRLLEALAATGQIYVPQFYDVSYGPGGLIAAVGPNRPGVPARVDKFTLMGLDDWPYPKHPIVPLAETVHERFSAEIFRGCLRGCRFCQAGMITRPVRERSMDVIGEMIDCGLQATGYDEVGLLSLSSADHSQMAPLAAGLARRYQGTNISLSLPSTRVDAFNIDLAEELSRNGRRSGLTFAPEGGTERMRRVINKNVDEADLLATVEAAFARGWRSVKLYFMAGVPTETDADVAAIG